MKFCNQGSSHLLMCFFLFVLSGLMVIVIGQSVNTYEKTSEKLNTLLCMRKSQYYLAKLVSSVAKSNQIIRINFPLKHSKIPYISQAATVLVKGLIIKQNYDLAAYYKNVKSIKECSKVCRVQLLKAHPYRVKLGFSRYKDDTTILRKNYFSVLYFSKSLLGSLKSRVEIKSSLSTKIYIKTKKVTPSLNAFSSF